MASNKSQFITNELKSIISLGPAKRHWSIPLMASLCVGIPMLIGLLTDNFVSSLTVSLGGLVILHLPAKDNIVGRISKMLLCSFGFIIAYLVGITFSFNPYVSCVAFGLFSGCIYFISKMVQLAPPGNFFFIMIAAMASGISFQLNEIPSKIGLVTLGTLLSCFIAFVFSVLIFKPNIQKDVKETLSNIYISKEVDYLEAFIVGFFMFGSFLIAHFLELNNPYWVPISCLAVMQGATTHHIWRRGFYRISGTILGMILCLGILIYADKPIEMILTIMVLQYIIEVLIVKNYFLAVLFITPMTLLLSEAGSNLALDPTILITARLKDVLIGSLFGIFGGWLIYNEKLRYEVVKHVRFTKRKF